MTNKPVFDARTAEPFNQDGQIWNCSIPVREHDLNRATYTDLLRSDFWKHMVRYHVKPGDLLIATANDFSFSAVLLIRGVDERNGLIVVAPLMGAAFEDQPILINIEIFIRKTLKKSVGVFKKFNGELELIKDGFAAEAEAEAWARRLGAHEVSLLKPAAATIEV